MTLPFSFRTTLRNNRKLSLDEMKGLASILSVFIIGPKFSGCEYSPLINFTLYISPPPNPPSLLERKYIVLSFEIET